MWGEIKPTQGQIESNIGKLGKTWKTQNSGILKIYEFSSFLMFGLIWVEIDMRPDWCEVKFTSHLSDFSLLDICSVTKYV